MPSLTVITPGLFRVNDCPHHTPARGMVSWKNVRNRSGYRSADNINEEQIERIGHPGEKGTSKPMFATVSMAELPEKPV